MTPRQRSLTAKDLHQKPVQRPRRGDAPLTPVDEVKAVIDDRVATADEVREVGERASTRWASLLKRLAE